MKKESLKTGQIDLDKELDFSGDDFNFDYTDKSLDKKRTAASPVKDGVKDAVRTHLGSDRNIRNYLGKALPREYADVFDTYTSVRDEASGALDDVKKATQKPVNDFARLIDEKVSSKHKRTKKALAWLLDKTDEYKFDKFDQRKADDDSINIAMGELQNNLQQSFAAQAQAAEDQRLEDKDLKNLEMTNRAITDARQTKLLNSIARSNDILAKTEMGFNIAEKKKSLELRYRMVYGIRDLVAGQRELTEVTRAHLKAIQHNTGLPEAQKLMMSERFHNTVKNKFVNGALGQFGPGGMLGGAMKNIRDRARETASDVGDAIGMAHSGVDMFSQDDLDFDDLTPEQKARKKRARMISGVALDYLGPKAVGKASESLRKRVPGLENKIQRGASKLGYAAQNADSIARDFANGGDATEGFMKRTMREMIGMALPSRDNDGKLRMATGDSLFEPGAGGNQATNRALVEVIPGLLARILQEQQIQRTGNTKQGLTSFDYESGVFRTSSDMKGILSNSFSKNSTSDMVLDNLVRTLEGSGAKLEKSDQGQLKRFLMSSRMSGGSISPDRLMDPSFYKGVRGEGTNERLAGAFRKHFESKDGKFTESDSNLQKRYQVIATINTAVKNGNDPRAIIQQAVSEGHTELLREMGWIKQDGSINLEKAYTYGMEGADAHAEDNSVWRAAQGKSGRRNRRAQPFEAAPPVFAPAPETAYKPSSSSSAGSSMSASLLEALIKGQATQNEWLEKIETNTAQPHYIGGEGSAGGQGEPGFMDRSVRSHAARLGNKVSNARKGAWNWLKNKSPLATKAKDALAGSWAFGARKFNDFKDGLPDLADLYTYGSEKVRISKAMFESKTLVDAKGKVIASIKDLAESVGDIKDQAGNVILTEGEKMSSYLKANGVTFTKQWYARLKAAGSKGLSFAGGLLNRARSAAGMMGNTLSGIGKAAVSLGLELIQPAVDVYVIGETSPRLLGAVMRKGAYFNQGESEPIERPVDINNAVVDRDGQVLITLQDMQKGLVNAQGKPFKTIMQMAADRIRTNIRNAKKAVGSVLKFGKSALSAAGSMLNGVKTGIGKFMSFGMSGFKGSDSAAQAAAQSPEAAASLNITILSQIRDILAERLPGGPSSKGSSFSGLFQSGSIDPVEQGTPNQGVPQGQTNTVSGAPIDPLGMLGKVGSMAATGLGKLGGLVKNRKGFLGKAGGWLRGLGASVTDSDASPEVMQKLKDIEDKQAAAQKGEKVTRMQGLRDKYNEIKTRGRGKPTATDLDGDGVKENSVLDKLRNRKNKNDASNARGGDREVQKFDTENAVDFVMGKLAAAKGLVGSLISGAADLFGMGGGGGKGRGRGRGRGGKLAKAGRVLARGSALRAAGGVALKAGVGAAKWGLTKALPFLVMRAIPAVVGAIGAVLGSPVIATAATIAAVGGLAWWGYKSFFKSNKVDDIKDSTSLKSVRMAEYGFSLDDTMQYGRIASLEKLLEPAIVKSDKGAELDKSKIPAQEVLNLFGVTEEEPTRVKALLGWIENRFKPTFLKWQSIAQSVNKPVDKFEECDKPTKMKILQTVEMTNTGWDAKTNPFGTESDLVVGTKEVKAIISAAKKLLEMELKGAKPDAKKLAEDVAKSGVTGSAAKQALESVDNKIGITNEMKEKYKNKSLADMAMGEGQDRALVNAAFKTGGLEALPGQRLDALTSIKLRAYGIAEPNMGSLQAINALELAASPFIKVDKNGSSSVNFDIEKLYDQAGKYFGIAKSNVAAYSAWREWVMKRFMPVFTTYRANLQFHTGIEDAALAHRSLTAVQTAAIAHQLVAVPDIWNASLSGWPGTPGSTDSAACDMFVKHLDAAAKKATLQEVSQSKAPSPSEGKAIGYAAQRYDGMPTPQAPREKNPYMQNALYKPPVPADAEVEPKSGSGGSSSAPKSSGSAIGSIPLAAGELATGNAGDQFINLRKGAKLEGMNPEMLKLFKGMAEEYGTMTGKQIPVNSGARDFESQMALYKANPGKAAKPGGSLHEKGLALDIDTATANELERLGLMRKYGFTRPVGGETWHIEPAGIQESISNAKNDPNFATQAILKSPGLGGGGAGMTKTSYALGKRSTQIAMDSMNASEAQAKAVPGGDGQAAVASSAGGASRGLNTGIANGAGGYASSVQAVQSNQSPSALREGSGLGSGAYAAMPAAGDRAANMALVKAAANAIGVDPNVALTTVALESSFKSNATPGVGTAKGLNQFTSGTWSDMMKKHGKDLGIPPDASPNDPRANALMGAQFLKTNLQTAQKRGMPADVVQAYLMHFLGAGGANTFNKLADNDIVAKAMPDAANANKPTFYDQSGKPRTKAEMLAFITNKINKSAKDFGIDLGSAAPSAGYSAGPQMASTAPSEASGGSKATMVSDKAAQAVNSPDYSQSYRPPRPGLGSQGVIRDTNPVAQTQGFDKLAQTITEGQDIQVKQLDALTGILTAVQTMASFMVNTTKESDKPATAETPQTRPAPGSSVRQVNKPLVVT